MERAAGGVEIGEGGHWSQNPPKLGKHDAFVLDWCAENPPTMLKEFGLMSELLKEIEFEEGEREYFLAKVDLVHQSIMAMQMRRAMERSSA